MMHGVAQSSRGAGLRRLAAVQDIGRVNSVIMHQSPVNFSPERSLYTLHCFNYIHIPVKKTTCITYVFTRASTRRFVVALCK